MKKQIIIGTTTVCGEGVWTAEYAEADEEKSIQVIGGTIPEAIGVLTGNTFEVVYTDAAKEKLESIQQAVACIDAANHPVQTVSRYEIGLGFLGLSQEVAENFNPGKL